MRVLPALVISGLLLAACDDSEDALEPPDVNVRQRSELFSIGPRGVPRVALIIVDDSPTPEAQALRDIAADRFLEHYTATRRNVPDDCILAPDPGAPAEVHYRVILLAPSAGGEAAFRSFVDDPSLAWDAPRQLEPELGAGVTRRHLSGHGRLAGSARPGWSARTADRPKVRREMASL